VIHTYRDPDVLESRALHFFLLPLIFGVAFVALTAAAGFAWGAPLGAFAGLVSVGNYFTYRRHRYGTCGEIRLGDDGTCELETTRQVIRLHVHEIPSVTFSGETDERSESYTIHYQGGRLAVTERMTGFADFLARLKTLNPAVDVSSFPANAWPDLGTSGTEERGTSVSRRILGALFPLAIIVALIWLALVTLTGLR
jgi:hypothetical protein